MHRLLPTQQALYDNNLLMPWISKQSWLKRNCSEERFEHHLLYRTVQYDYRRELSRVERLYYSNAVINSANREMTKNEISILSLALVLLLPINHQQNTVTYPGVIAQCVATRWTTKSATVLYSINTVQMDSDIRIRFCCSRKVRFHSQGILSR